MQRNLAENCSECDMHYVDEQGIDRCKEFNDAILASINEKHCINSIW